MSSTLLSASRSRSSSPQSSSNDNDDSAPSSHSSPDSFVFHHPTDASHLSQQTWKQFPAPSDLTSAESQVKNIFNANANESGANLWASMDYDYAALAKAAAGNAQHAQVMNVGSVLKAEDENDGGAVFSEFIQEDAFDPTPLSINSPTEANDSFVPAIKSSNHESHNPALAALPMTSPFATTFPNTLNLSQALSSFQPPQQVMLASRTINPQHAQQPPPLHQHQHQHQYIGLPQPVVRVNPASSASEVQVMERSSGLEDHQDAPVYPPKSSCSNLPIHISNVPKRGAKSRVETQIKMDLDLMYPIPSSDGSSPTYRRVGSWKWLRLNKGATTKRRPKKDVKQEALTDDTLYLSTEVICATAPNLKVHSCTNCIAREAKRLERKKASRVRPVREDSSSEDESTAIPRVVQEEIRAEEEETDDLGRIVLFNCHELVDISTGTASLPVRITCYCRHHREKLGFSVIFTMRDASGKIVGKGTAPPVMITDDHKSTQKNSGPADDDEEVDEPPQAKRKRRMGSKKDSEPDGDVNMEDDDEEGDPSSARGKRKTKPGSTAASSNVKKHSNRSGTVSGKTSRKTTPSRRSSPPLSTSGSVVMMSPPVPQMTSRSSIQMAPLSNSPTHVTSNPYPTIDLNWPMTQVCLEPAPGTATPSATSPFDFNAMTAASAPFSAASTVPPSAAMSPPDATSLNAQPQVQQPNPAELDAVLASMIAMVGNGGLQDGTQSSLPTAHVSVPSPSTSRSSSIQPLQPLQHPYAHLQASSNLGPSVAPAVPSADNIIRLGSPIDGMVEPTQNPMLGANMFATTLNSPSVITPDFSTLLSQYPGSLVTAPQPSLPMSASAVVPSPPMIHRLVPSSGPMHGGIEVTILGANFRPHHECMFGDTVATRTQMWSENTIVCVLPPSPTPGPVVVGFKGVPLVPANSDPMEDVDGLLGLGSMRLGGNGPVGNVGLQLFTYLDNSDRALMEHALQVVGLKMTGRFEEAKNVAIRIIRTNSTMDMSSSLPTSENGNGGGSQMSLLTRSIYQQSPAASRRQSSADLTSLTSGGRPSRDFQSVIIEFLSLLDVELDESDGVTMAPISVADAISHPNATGQTLLHLACILGFHRLVSALISYGIDVDARDFNGYTALHFAAACGRLACARTLVNEGHADVEIVDGRGKTAAQIALDKDQADVHSLLQSLERSPSPSSPTVDSEDARAVYSSHSAEEADEEDAAVEDEHEDQWPEDQSEADEDRLEMSPRSSRVHAHGHGRSLANRITFRDSPREPASELYTSQDEAEDVIHTSEPPDRGQLLKELKREGSWFDHKPPSIVDASSAWLHRKLAQLHPPPALVPGVPWLRDLQMPDILAFQMQMPTLPWQAGGERGEPWSSWYTAGYGGWWSEKPTRLAQPPATSTNSVPMYMPDVDEIAVPTSVALDQAADMATASHSSQPKVHPRTKSTRRPEFDPGRVTDKEVLSFAYYSGKMRKLKEDRMLLLFWLPILLIVIAWLFYESVYSLPTAVTSLKSSVRGFLPFRNVMEIGA